MGEKNRMGRHLEGARMRDVHYRIVSQGSVEIFHVEYHAQHASSNRLGFLVQSHRDLAREEPVYKGDKELIDFCTDVFISEAPFEVQEKMRDEVFRSFAELRMTREPWIALVSAL